MADGGKPLGEAKIKLSVEGADQVRAELKGAAGETENFAKTMGQLADAEAKAVGTLQDHTKETERAVPAVKSLNDRIGDLNNQAKDFTGNGLRMLSMVSRLAGIAGAAVGGVTALALAVKKLGDEFNGVAAGKGGDAARKFLVESGQGAAMASRDVDELTRAFGLLNDRMTELAQQGPKVFGAERSAEQFKLALAWKETAAAIQEATAAQEKAAKQAMIQADIEAANAAARATVQGEYLATLTEEEQYLKRIEALEKARAQLASQGGSPRDIQAIIDRIKAEYEAKKAAERQAEEDKRKSDEERAREQEQRDKERRDKDAAARKKQIEDEAKQRIQAQQRVFEEGRRESERALASIAVTSANAAQLLRTISAARGGTPWL